MKTFGGSWGAAVAMLVVASPLLAADGTPRCTEFFDDARRLACYDAQFGKPVRPVASPVSVAVPTAPASTAASQVAGHITQVKRVGNGRFQITLDGGQSWSQLERDLTAEVAIGDTVSIRPAMLGSWMLETRNGVRTRVRPVP